MRYAVSDLYQGDLGQLLKGFDVESAILLDEAYELDFASPKEHIVERLLTREGALVRPSKPTDELEASFAASTASYLAPGMIRHQHSATRHEILMPQFISGRYWLQRPLGEGTFGVIYKSLDTLSESFLH